MKCKGIKLEIKVSPQNLREMVDLLEKVYVSVTGYNLKDNSPTTEEDPAVLIVNEKIRDNSKANYPQVRYHLGGLVLEPHKGFGMIYSPDQKSDMLNDKYSIPLGTLRYNEVEKRRSFSRLDIAGKGGKCLIDLYALPKPLIRKKK